MELFKPIKIKDLEIKNKIVMPPMCMYSADNGFVSDFHIIHYASRAAGQVGLIIVEATAVEPNGRITDKDLGIWSDEHIKGLSWIVNRVHFLGGKIGIQLAHAGRKAKDTNNRIAPSAIAYGDLGIPHEMTLMEIEEIIDSFRKAARRAYIAGFDFIEIHAAHGYLINEFLSPLSNKRRDLYGGTQENRSRLLYDIIKAVRLEWPDEKPLGIRVSATEYHPDGLKPDDIVQIINNIDNNLIDVVDVSTGGIILKHVDEYPGYQIAHANKIKRETPYLVIGGGVITDPLFAEDILRNNEADMLYFGRISLREPYFPIRFSIQTKQDIPWLKQYERAKNK